MGKSIGLKLIVLWTLFILGQNNVLAEQKIVEFTDNEHNYAFQFPSDWKIQKPQVRNEYGEVRVVVQGSGQGTVMAMVTELGKSISKERFTSDPNRNAVIEQLIDLTIVQVYKKTSRDVKATEMLVSERKIIPFEAGISFYISTAHFFDKGIPMLVAGIHTIPFGEDHMITFMMTTFLDSRRKKENETLTHIFNSFHLLGEQPIADELRSK